MFLMKVCCKSPSNITSWVVGLIISFGFLGISIFSSTRSSLLFGVIFVSSSSKSLNNSSYITCFSSWSNGSFRSSFIPVWAYSRRLWKSSLLPSAPYSLKNNLIVSFIKTDWSLFISGFCQKFVNFSCWVLFILSGELKYDFISSETCILSKTIEFISPIYLATKFRDSLSLILLFLNRFLVSSEFPFPLTIASAILSISQSFTSSNFFFSILCWGVEFVVWIEVARGETAFLGLYS